MSDLQTLHPDRERLTAFGLGRLSDEESRPIEQHLLDCPECRQQVENLAGDSLVVLLQSSVTDTHTDHLASVPTAAEKSAQPKEESLPPLYKKLKGIIDGKEASLASAPLAAEASPAFEIPKELQGHSRYEVLAPLGAGGMGTVFKSQHRLMQRVVALKIVNPLLVNKPGAVERFEREVKAAAQLVHPNIVTAYDAEKVGDMHVLVMEFVEGQTLAQLLFDKRELPVGAACEYIRQTAVGLQHALERGMVHRDIKPQNLMVVASPDPSAPGVIKILDFGLARFTSEQAAADEASEQAVALQAVVGRATRDGALMGSPDYLAPEQARDAHSADARADIYGMGCTLYHLLAGEVPFPVSSLIDKLIAHRDQQPIPLNHVRPDVPAKLAKVIEKMMAKDPAQRYQTPAEVAEALRPFTQLQPQTGRAESRERPGESASSRRPIYGLAIIAALMLVGIGYWLAQIVFRVETPNGTLIVETDDPDVKISVSSGGKEVEIFFPKKKKSLPLKIGEYTIEVVQGKEGFKLSANKFTIENDKMPVTVTYAPIRAENKKPKDPEPKKGPRRLAEVVNLDKALFVVNEQFDDPKFSSYGGGFLPKHFKNGRIELSGEHSAAWHGHHFTSDMDIVCEVTGTFLAGPHRGWGLAIIDGTREKEGALAGIEVVLNSEGELHLIPSRWVTNEALKIRPVGPIQVANFKKGVEPNSLTAILRGGKTVELFVNGVEACPPITLSPEHVDRALQLTTLGGAKDSMIAFESLKVWHLEPPPAPIPSVAELLKTREVRTVAQDGSGEFKTIQAALDKVQANQVIHVKGKGPYRETPRKDDLPPNVALVSLDGTRVEVDQYKEDNKWFFAAWLRSRGAIRVSGLTWVGGPMPKDAKEPGAVLLVTGFTDMVIDNGVFVSPAGQYFGLRYECHGIPARTVVQDNYFDSGFFAGHIHGTSTIEHNWFVMPDTAPFMNLCHSGRVTVRENVFQNDWGFRFDPIEVKTRSVPGVDVRYHNNVIEGTESPGYFYGGTSRLPTVRSVEVANNIMRTRKGHGILLLAEVMEKVKDRWKIWPNVYDVEPKGCPAGWRGVVSWSRGPKDVLSQKHFLSVNPQDANYLRIAADDKLARGGAGGDLPSYFGAFPPGPAPKGGDWFTRLQELARGSKPAQPNVKELLASARKALEKKDYALAWSLSSDAMQADPKNIEVYLLRSDVKLAQGLNAEAIPDLEKSLELDPAHEGAALSLAFAISNSQPPDIAIARLSKMLERYPAGNVNVVILNHRGNNWCAKGRFDKALVDYEAGIKAHPKFAGSYHGKAAALDRIGKNEAANSVWAELAKLNPDLKRGGPFCQWLRGITSEFAPLEEWRNGRTFLTVAQKGPADFRTIQDALNALKEGQYVKVLDKGPYHETLVHLKWPKDVGLISDVGTRIEPTKWHEWGLSADKKKKIYLGAFLRNQNGFRLSGIDFMAPPIPADTDFAHAWEIGGVGDTVIESCRVRYRRDFTLAPPANEVDLWNRTDALVLNNLGGSGRFLVQDSLFDGGVHLTADAPVQSTVRRNWIRAWNQNTLSLPMDPLSDISVTHNIIQGTNGIVQRARGRDGAAMGRCVIANNTIDVVNGPVWCFTPEDFPEGERPDRKDITRAVTIQNNIIRSQSGAGLQAPLEDQKTILGVWKLGHNSFTVEPKQIPTNQATMPKQPSDLIVAGPFLSDDPKHADFLRIPAESRQATAGAKGELPAYLGALQPGPAPKDGDWFTRLQERAKR